MRKGTTAIIALVVFLVVAGLRGYDVLGARREAIQAAQARADNLALILASYIDESAQGADAARLMAARLRDVNVGARGSIAVARPDGVVLFREPAAAAMGQPAVPNPIVAAARSQTPPLVVSVSMDRDEVLADWRRSARNSGMVFVIICTSLVVAVMTLFRQIDAQTAVEHALSEAQAQEQNSLRVAHDRLVAALAREQVARTEAESASALKDDFLMTVSHELRTPLTAIYGWARMLSQDAVSDAHRERAIKTIERNAEAQTRLIDDLLDVSGVITGKLRLDARSVEPVDVVRNAIETASPAAAAKSIRLETFLDSTTGPVLGDPERLQQVVWNLLSNATKFTPSGGTVRVSVARDKDDVTIEVSDTGVGISPEFLPHVFDRFRQEESGSRRRFGGLGLGLAIARNLVELHGGTLTVESEGSGKGATFLVRLPIAREAALSARVRKVDGRPLRRLDHLNVMVVDDDPEALELLGAVLENAGATVTRMASADAALSKMSETMFDVLVSDIEMPDVDGYALGRIALAAAREVGHPLVAIAVTAYSRPEDEERSLNAGFARHLSKPIDPALLVSTIAEVTAAVV